MTRNWRHKEKPHEPADWDEDVQAAVEALSKGLANDHQQRLVWDYLMYVSGVDDWAYRPDSAGAGAKDLVLGKQFVGHTFRKMLAPETKQVAAEMRRKAAQRQTNQKSNRR